MVKFQKRPAVPPFNKLRDRDLKNNSQNLHVREWEDPTEVERWRLRH
jgi:hypothetical protein